METAQIPHLNLPNAKRLTCETCLATMTTTPLTSKITLADIDESAHQCNFSGILQKVILDFGLLPLGCDHRLMACAHYATPSADCIWEWNDNSTSASLYTNYTGEVCASFPVSGRRNITTPRETAFLEPISTWLQKCNKEHQC